MIVSVIKSEKENRETLSRGFCTYDLMAVLFLAGFDLREVLLGQLEDHG